MQPAETLCTQLAKKYKNFKKLPKNVKYDFILNEASFTALFVFAS